MPAYDEFVNPKSMLAPGVAGVMIIAITNAIAVNFDLPSPWLGLFVSGFFAAAAVAHAQMRVIGKTFFGVLNTWIIFSVALGTNTLGSAVAPPAMQASLLRGTSPFEWVVRSAVAQPLPTIPDGTLVKGSGPQLYLIKGSYRPKKRHHPSSSR